MKISRQAFTLIELLVVILIVAILASIAVPIMRSAKKRAIVSEAIAAMGTIRTAERLFYIENNCYVENTALLGFTPRPDNFTPGYLDGVYFTYECFVIRVFLVGGKPSKEYRIICYPGYSNNLGTLNIAPKGEEVRGWVTGTGHYISMDQDGNIYSDFNELGYDEDPDSN